MNKIWTKKKFFSFLILGTSFGFIGEAFAQHRVLERTPPLPLKQSPVLERSTEIFGRGCDIESNARFQQRLWNVTTLSFTAFVADGPETDAASDCFLRLKIKGQAKTQYRIKALTIKGEASGQVFSGSGYSVMRSYYYLNRIEEKTAALDSAQIYLMNPDGVFEAGTRHQQRATGWSLCGMEDSFHVLVESAMPYWEADRDPYFIRIDSLEIDWEKTFVQPFSLWSDGAFLKAVESLKFISKSEKRQARRTYAWGRTHTGLCGDGTSGE